MFRCLRNGGNVHISGDPFAGGQFVGAMYAEAFVEKDIEKIIDAGLMAIPSKSQYTKGEIEMITVCEDKIKFI